jgi:beta-lactamase class A
MSTVSPMFRFPGRRDLLVSLSAALLPVVAHSAGPLDALAQVDRASGGRLGVYALDTGNGRALGHRADERFLMFSTFKLLLAAAVLARVASDLERLNRRVSYTAADLLSNAPVSHARVAEGGLTVATLCRAAVEVSDNTAANLLLKVVGGPSGVTRFARGIGDGVTRLDRIELTLNDPHGELDTTTPRAMVGSMRVILLGSALDPAARTMLEGWMRECTTGRHRLRAGLPSAWVAGDKTGTGDTQTNDLAIIRPPGRAPLLVAAYYQGGPNSTEGREAVLRRVGSILASWAA